MITVWQCSDMELRWIEQLCAEQELEHDETLIESDIQLSRDLALDALEGGEMPVPWYADEWTETVEPEIVNGWLP